MKTGFDLVDYPLKIKENTNLIYNYTRSKIEFKLLNTPDSKMIYATKSRCKELYILLEIEEHECDVDKCTIDKCNLDKCNLDKCNLDKCTIDDKCNIDKCNIVGYTNNLFMFDGPLDFYIDNSDSLPFYSNLANILINGNITQLLDFSQTLPEKFPPYNPPIVNHYEKDSKIISVTQNPPAYENDQKAIRVYYDEEIPNKSLPNIELDEISDKISDFIINLPYPILKINVIKSLFSEYKKEHKLNCKTESMKSMLSLYRYFINDGPFRKSWVPFGYDPKKYKENYKYQIIDLRAEGTFFHLFEKESIIKEVENNMSWYVKDECDIKNGFFKKTLSQLILYQNYVEFEKSEGEECFEILD